MAELGALAELTDETRSELDTLETGTPDLERQIRARPVLVVEADGEGETRETGDDPDAETRELRELRGKIQTFRVTSLRLSSNGPPMGPKLEYNSSSRNIAGNRFPLEILAPSMEVRATTDRDTDAATVSRRWLDRLFAGTAAERIGITMESVPSGVASIPRDDCRSAGAAQRGNVQPMPPADTRLDRLA